MTIFEEYINSKREENKLEMDYAWAFHDYNKNMCNISKTTRNNLYTCRVAFDKLEEIIDKRKNIVNEICALSFITDYEADTILCEFLKDTCMEDYELKSLIIDGVRRVFLIKKGASLDFRLTMDNLLANESIIFLASTSYSNGFNLYQSDKDNKEAYCEISDNLYFDATPNDAQILRNFIDGYIVNKAKKKEFNLERYYLATSYESEKDYTEDFSIYYDIEDAYLEHDRKAARRAKRIKDADYHKKQRDSKNRVIAQRKLGKLPSKYEPTEEDEIFNFIKGLEIDLGKKFSSLEKENINSWLTVGFSEELVAAAYKEASTRGNYNNSSIAEILRDFSRLKSKEQKDNSSLTIFEKIEFQREKLLTPLEKDIINNWLMAGFSENVIFAALEEARLNGDLNINVITNILNELENRGIKSKDDISRINKDYKTKVQKNRKLTKKFEE